MAAPHGKKIGGLPPWAWGAIAVGGLLLAFYIRSRNSSAQTVTIPVAADTSGGSVGANMASAPSGLDPTIEALLAALASGQYATVVTGSTGAQAGSGAGAASGTAKACPAGLACGNDSGRVCPEGMHCSHTCCVPRQHPRETVPGGGN